jgi:hypothetical protein
MKTNIPQNSIEIKMKKILSNLDMDELYEIDGIGYKITISLINNDNKGTFIEFLSCEEKIKKDL